MIPKKRLFLKGRVDTPDEKGEKKGFAKLNIGSG